MSAHEPSRTLRVARVAERCRVLGPGTRSVVWVQGCALRCRECIAPEALPMSGGRELTAKELSARLLGAAQPGLTLSGGEPFLQAAALVELVDRMRERRPGLSVMSYSGYTLARLRRRGDAAQRALLARLDILVDGPYLPERHAALRWRGSSNQRLHVLSDRHPDLLAELDLPSGIDVEIDPDGRMRWSGVPPIRGFQEQLEGSLIASGLAVQGDRRSPTEAVNA